MKKNSRYVLLVPNKTLALLLASSGGSGSGGGDDGCGCGLEVLVFPATADRDTSEGATFGPVPLACPTKVARLGFFVVVVVAKFGV